MSIAYKSNGAMVSSVSASTLPLPIPALVSGDYVVAMVIAFAAGTVTPPSGWAEASTAWLEGSFYYHVFWKKVSGASSATTENFTMPSVGYAGKATVVTGAAASAPTWTHVNNGSSVAYWATPALTTTGFYVANGILFSSRTPSGSFTTTGTVTSTNTYLNHESFTGSGISGFRWELATYTVSAVTSGATIRAGLSGGNTTSDVIAILIPPDVGDTTNPVVSITAPVDSATIAGVSTLTATLTDNIAVVSASALLDGTTSLGALTNTSGTTWSLSVDTTVIANGAHTVTVTALDGSGNSSTDSVSVTVLNEFNTISSWNGLSETVLSPSTLTYWDGDNEYGFWYPHVSTYHPSGPAHKLSYWDGSTESVIRLVDNPTTSALDGLTYLALGDSYGVVQTVAGVDYTASDLFPAQLATALGATLTNGHVNSYMAMDVATIINNVSGAGGAWTAGNFGMVTIHVGGNDFKLVGTPGGLAEYVNGIQTILGLMRLATRVLASATTSTGAWGSLGSSGTSGGALYSNTPGSSRTFTATGTGFTVIMLAGRDGTGSTFTVSVDGGTPVAYTTVDQAGTNPVVSGSYGPVPVHIHNLSSGSHTIKVTHTGSSSDYLLIDSLSVWATDPDDIPYVLIAPPPNPPNVFVNDSGVTVTPEDVQTYRDALRDILAEHADVGKFAMLIGDSYDKIFWDAVSAGDPILISDGMHPNKAGCDLLAEVWIGNARRIFPVPAPALPDAIAAYSFDEGSGTSSVDQTGNGHTATVYSFGAGLVSYGAVGDSSHSAASYTGSLLTTPTELTVLCWAKPVTPSGQPDIITVLSNDESNYVGAYWVDSSNIKLFVQDSNAYVESSTVTLPVGSWTHIAIVVTTSDATMYFNGASVASVSRSGTFIDLEGVFLGGHGSKSGGTYDDLRVFNTALTSSEVTAFMNTPVTANPKPSIITIALDGVYTGLTFSQTITATNTPTSWAIASGTLPVGLSLNTSTGAITGTPTGTSGTSFSFSLTATNSSGTSGAVTYSGTVTTLPSPLVAWAADEGSGTAAIDASGNSYTGVAQSDGWTTGHSTHTYAAAGNSSYPAVEIEGTTLFSGSKTATIMCWVKAVSLTGSGDLLEIKSVHDGSGTALTIYRPTETSFQAYLRDSNLTETTTATYPSTITGVWHHIAAVLSATQLELYIDGVLAETQTVAGTGTLGDIQLFYAGGTDTKFNQGAVNDVRLFDTALTAADVSYFMDTPIVTYDWPSTLIDEDPTSGFNDGGTGMSLGFVFGTVNAETALGVRFFATQAGLSIKPMLIDDDGDILAIGSNFVTSAAGWNYLPFDAPIDLPATSGDLVAMVYESNAQKYTATSGVWPTDHSRVTLGSTGVGSGRFFYSVDPPSSGVGLSRSTTWYGVDIILR